MSQSYRVTKYFGDIIENINNNAVIQASSDVVLTPEQNGVIVLINVNTGVNVTMPFSTMVQPGFSATVYYNCTSSPNANNSRFGISHAESEDGYFLYGGIINNTFESGTCSGGIFTTSAVIGDYITITLVGPNQGFISGANHNVNGIEYDD